MTLTVLVTATGAGVGQGIIKALRLSNLPSRIVAADINPGAAGLYRADVGILLPHGSSPRYIDEVILQCRKHQVGAVLVGSDAELPAIAEGKPRIESETRAKVIVSSPRVTTIGCDKWATSQFFREKHFRHPRTFIGSGPQSEHLFQGQLPFPLIIKPRFGSGSRGVYLVQDSEELRVLMRRVKEPLVQEYLGGDDQEYTCGVMMTTEGEIPGIVTMRREIVNGNTYRAWVDDYPEVREEVRRIAEALRPLGPCNIQLRKTDNGVIAFEINPRFSGTTAIKARFGFNEPEMALRSIVLGETLPNPRLSSGVAFRYWNEVYTTYEAYSALATDGEQRGSPSEVLQNF
ncbi:MAG: ATP-grasp domain-containing protein [Chloroflexi bacterium]|nr:ATP-grasp domain-containing protein [Chloroflexota bacterium]